MFQFDRNKGDIISFHLRCVIKEAFTRSTMYSHCAAIRRVLDYTAVFKNVSPVVHLVIIVWLKASLTNRAVMKRGHCASACITRCSYNAKRSYTIQKEPCINTRAWTFLHVYVSYAWAQSSFVVLARCWEVNVWVLVRCGRRKQRAALC